MSIVKAKKNGNGNGSLFPSVLSNFFSTDVFGRPTILEPNWAFPDTPSVNITENNKNFKIEMAAPGLNKKDFKVETDNGVLTLSYEKKNEENKTDENYTRREFSYESFSRSFTLPENSLPEKILAHYEDGILRLELPKKEVATAKPKKEIPVA
ncbi:MAG TPA: Hsp20/alpha crystallin family protein [Bacteroidia bacterium]|nr:Hsp20/alpha crystallin family protein [Bacteroidia bacterium]